MYGNSFASAITYACAYNAIHRYTIGHVNSRKPVWHLLTHLSIPVSHVKRRAAFR